MPETDADKLNSVLEKQDVLLNLLHNVKSNHLDFLSQDILFKTILKNYRSPVQPASIDFWLSRDTTWKTNNLNLWLEPLLFIKKSIDFILELIRKSGSFKDKLAERGFYIKKLNPQKNILLVRIILTADLYYYPHVSVGKQRLNIMFMTKDENNNLIQYQEDVQFILTTCAL